MSVVVRFAPDLVLRNYVEYEAGLKQPEECIPSDLQEGVVYDFLKQGQRAYWLEGEQPLLEKSQDGRISKPLASVVILEATHFLKEGKVYTKGRYKVVKILQENEVYFNGCEPIR